jgi:hypothetical protein
MKEEGERARENKIVHRIKNCNKAKHISSVKELCDLGAAAISSMVSFTCKSIYIELCTKIIVVVLAVVVVP